ncbi:UDP-2,4-diacetamido-2,4,6-trideoxy-beta-L-altropyranose hydrolase [Parageobacillus toebii]|uniref:UDP-2,4-diacetamido-2,4, 6-trideoxy-beta-L-altropyranose hydrolase n=1 Tax=Parageobacillus toebii TaxID=153151 RepID=UPI002815E43B|nr:UDP-2,4-diacetamido-2,4,6-trideoxy-beta-L-altropyranose hydrolase [Parageobacillus toebii]WMT18326.1 UDP-2,4-diacetamido-2,4,6-trideoxy-beta-L-altropyranose hydrolase [Parageobacillus toebii]
MNVVFRVDSSSDIGTGHVMRCLTLAKQLKQKDANISFICREHQGDLINFIKDNGFTVYNLPKIMISEKDNNAIFKWYQENWKQDVCETQHLLEKHIHSVDFFIVDHYGLDEKWESQLKPFTKKLMVIDDLANRKHVCDVLLDQNWYLNYEERYKDLVSSECRQLLGPNYVLLRDEFIEAFHQKRARSGKIHNILVFFGGTDPTNETIKTLNALVLLENNIKVNVVVGASNKRKDEIRKFCSQHSNFFFHCQVSNMAELMNEADVAIGAGGTTTWERCYLGLPSITIIVADNQAELTDAVSQFGATINLGFSYNVTSNQIVETVNDLIKHPKKVKLLSERAANLVNKEIVNSYPVVKAIMEELK